jgi:hypothetical protein
MEASVLCFLEPGYDTQVGEARGAHERAYESGWGGVTDGEAEPVTSG